MTNLFFPSVVSPGTAQILHIVRQLAAFEADSPARQAALQSRQLTTLLRHARDRSPFWANRIPSLDDRIAFEDLPVLTRDEIQTHGMEMRCAGPLPGGGQTETSRTSGSTGKPVEVVKSTPLFGMLYAAQYMRMHAWHKLDAKQDVLLIRDGKEGRVLRAWGKPLAELGGTGQAFSRNMVENSPEALWTWMRGHPSPYLFTTPSMALRLARLALADTGAPMRLDAVVTFGEVVGEEHRDVVRRAFGARIIDRYSCEEVGWMAFQCPRHNHYHSLSASLHLEIVDDDNRPVKAGEEGRVLVTPLHHYAMPLVRYEIGDRAVAGEPCDCGIGLPVIREILGRERSFITLPDGCSRLARLTGEYWRQIAPIDEYRVVQYRDGVIEAFVTAPRALTAEETATLRAMLHQQLHPDLEMHVTQVERIDWPSRWKRIDIARVDRLRGEA